MTTTTAITPRRQGAALPPGLNGELPAARSDAMLDALRVLRGFLSVAAAVLVILQPDDRTVSLGLAFTGFAMFMAALNLFVAVVGRVRPRVGELLTQRWSIGQIVVDGVLALAIMLVVDVTTTPLLWIALLVPVLDASESHGGAGAITSWAAVSVLHIALQLHTADPDHSSGDLIRITIQQLAAVGAIVVPASIVASRLRNDLQRAGHARTRADLRASHLRRLSLSSEQMAAARRPADVLVLAARSMCAIGYDRADIAQRRPGALAWTPVVAVGNAAANDTNDDATVRTMNANQVVNEGLGSLDVDRLRDLTSLGYRSRTLVAFEADDGSVFVFRAWHVQGVEADAPEVESLGVLVHQARAAWHAARTYETLARWSSQLEHDASHDALTGLPNRSQLFKLLSDVDIAECSLMFLDLDGFKAVNDEIGHDAGDAVLVHVADRLRNAVGENDVAVRLGGDEFVVVAPWADVRRAQSLAMDIVEALTVPIDLGLRDATVGTSIGIAVGVAGEAPDSLLRRADAAMYVAKTAGGSGYHVSDETPVTATAGDAARRRGR